MTTAEKEVIFRNYQIAERNREEADPNNEQDSYYFGAYNALDDIVCELGLADEYNEWKERNNK